MKFCDKLIALRKKNGLSQEDLAAKLNVSRQSVSKWESGNAYPETDKIISIANLFDCSMDDLINDNITDLENMERKNKNVNNAIDSFLEFLTKTINMFYDMKFISRIKCLIEILILMLIVFFSGFIIISILDAFIYDIINTFDAYKLIAILKIFTSILNIIWFIISLIIVIHIFKIRYLDYYDSIIKTDDKKETNNKDKLENKKEKIEIKDQHEKIELNEKKEKIIIRDEKHRTFAFLELFSKIIIWCVKFTVVWFSFLFIFTLVALIAMLVITVSLFIFNPLFTGINIILISLIAANIAFLILIFNFVFNKKSNIKLLFLTLFTSIILCGIGFGLVIVGLKDYTIKDTMMEIPTTVIKTKEINYDKDMVIYLPYEYSIEYIISNNDNLKLEYKSIGTADTYYFSNSENLIKIYYLSYRYDININELYKIIRNDLKNNIISSYSVEPLNIKVYTNKNNIENIINNMNKVFYYDINKTDSGYVINHISHK